MILKLENEILNTWDVIDGVEDVRLHRQDYLVKIEEGGSDAQSSFFCIAKDYPEDLIEDATFMISPVGAEKNDQVVKIVSFFRPTSKEETVPREFCAYQHGYLLNDNGKTIDHI